MKGDYNKRIRNVLSAIDLLTAHLGELWTEQQLRVRDGNGRDRLTAYRACQHCAATKSALDLARATLFTDPTMTFHGADGQVDTDQNEEALCMRFHDSAANLGLTAEQCADAVLTVAAAHVVSANSSLVEAQYDATQSELDELLRHAFCD